jgi:hypothetical protein
MDHIDRDMGIAPPWAFCGDDERQWARSKAVAEKMLRSGEFSWNVEAWCDEIYAALQEERKMGKGSDYDSSTDERWAAWAQKNVIENGQYFECRCACDEHVLRFTYVSMPDPEPEVYVSVYLYSAGFFQRLWNAVKYVFGHTSKYGDFDCVSLKENHVVSLIKLLEAYRDDMRERKEQYLKKETPGAFKVVSHPSDPLRTRLSGSDGLVVEIAGGRDLVEHVGLVDRLREMKGWPGADVYKRDKPEEKEKKDEEGAGSVGDGSPVPGGVPIGGQDERKAPGRQG